MSTNLTLPAPLDHQTAESRVSLAGAVGVLAFFVIMASGGIDWFGTLRVAGYSVQALLTVAYLFFGVLLLVAIPTQALIPIRTIPFFLFLFWGACSLLWTPSIVSGSQNLLVIANLLVLSLVSESLTRLEPTFASRIRHYLNASVLVASAAYAVSIMWFGSGTSEIVGARTFSLFALFGVAGQLARWRYGDRRGLLWAFAITVLIGISHSRFSLGIAVILFPLCQWPTSRIRSIAKMAAVGAISTGLAIFSVFYFEALRQRFFTGDVSLKVGSYAINASGRLAFWDATLTSFQEAPLIGKGAGSAQYLVESVFVSMTHPHSDYVRIAHDYGIVGSFLWLLVIGCWLTAHFRYWKFADRVSRPLAQLQLTALLSLVGFVLQMLMENTLVYIFIAAPLGLLLGAAAGLIPARSRMLADRVA